MLARLDPSPQRPSWDSDFLNGLGPLNADRGKGNFNATLGGNLEVEMEQWLWPMGYRPEPGDRIYMVGRWIIDCGHDNWGAELHPLEMYVSSHMESVARVASNPSAGNPFINVDYSAEPQGARSQVSASVVVTDAWPGGTLDFDVWAPPRPSANSKLKYTAAVARDSALYELKIALTVTDSQQPAGNPNRVHVTVTSIDPGGNPVPRTKIRTKDLNDVYYLEKTDKEFVRRYVARYVLWWETPKSAPIPPKIRSSERP